MQVPKGPANDWSIEEVIQFITATDPALAVHADLFRKHVSLSPSSSSSPIVPCAFSVY